MGVGLAVLLVILQGFRNTLDNIFHFWVRAFSSLVLVINCTASPCSRCCLGLVLSSCPPLKSGLSLVPVMCLLTAPPLCPFALSLFKQIDIQFLLLILLGWVSVGWLLTPSWPDLCVCFRNSDMLGWPLGGFFLIWGCLLFFLAPVRSLAVLGFPVGSCFCCLLLAGLRKS